MVTTWLHHFLCIFSPPYLVRESTTPLQVGATTFMASTHKKVIVRKMSRDTVQGFVTPDEYISGGRVSLLNTAGNLVQMELVDVKAIHFVRDFTESGELTRKTFASRPRTEGLWVKLEFKDTETLEGLLPNDLNLLTAEGYLLA